MNARQAASEPLQPPYVLAIDVGTSSTRVLLYDRFGRSVPGIFAHEAYTMAVQPGGVVEVDVDHLLEVVFRQVDTALAQAASQGVEVRTVATGSFVTSTLGLDEAGKPLTPLIPYSDTRSRLEAQELRQTLDEASLHQRTGTPLHASYWPSRLVWFARRRPEVFSRAARWVSLGEYLALRLTGEEQASLSSASWTGLLDLRENRWDEALLAALSIRPEQMSALTDLDRPLGALRPEFAERWPQLRNASWFPAIGDGAGSNVGNGCVTPSRLAINIGTSSAVRAVLSGAIPEIPPGLWCYRVDRNRPLLGGALTEGGSVYAWLGEILGQARMPAFERAAAALPPDSSGLTVLPLIGGERSPGWRESALGAIAGLSLGASPASLLQGVLEGVTYRVAQVAALVAVRLGSTPQVVASGGAVEASPFWAQLLADVLGQPVLLAEGSDASARGTALLAFDSLGLEPDLAAASSPSGKLFHPDMQKHAVYARASARQQELYQKLYGE